MTLLAAVLLFALAGCSKTCKVKDCDGEVYKDGFCQYHYMLNGLEEAADAAGDFFGDLFG